MEHISLFNNSSEIRYSSQNNESEHLQLVKKVHATNTSVIVLGIHQRIHSLSLKNTISLKYRNVTNINRVK